MAKPKIVIGLSGGVDSSVAALLLKKQGYAVTGVFMKNWEDDDDSEYCSTRQDFIDAAAAADVIGIDFEAVNFAAEYKDRVFADFLREYSAGRTPNPDVLCNAEIKFKAFLDHAIALGAEKIATGHYAKVDELDGRFRLLRGDDVTKDQSYFLHRLNQYQLSKTLFPVGHLRKEIVRQIARDEGLPNHAKKDSTGICFIGERPFREFLQRYLPRNPGFMVTPEGTKLGRHEGLMYYTLGQRQGLGIGGIKPINAAKAPVPRGLAARLNKASTANVGNHAAWYVAEKNMARNELVVVQGHDHALLQKPNLMAQDASWAAGLAPVFDPTKALGAKTRYRQTDAPCAYTNEVTSAEFALAFDVPQWAVTPGQSAVLYQGDECLGGGIIVS